MAASISRLVTKPEKLQRDHAAEVREAFKVIEEQYSLPIDLMREVHLALERRTVSNHKWTFVMLSPSQNNAVVQHLAATSSRPIIAIRLWATCFEYLRNDTGEVLLSRDQIADKLGMASGDVSRVMGELESCGAIIRRREKTAGMKGPGLVRYFMNPRVATHLGGEARDQAQDDAPLLTFIQGGKA